MTLTKLFSIVILSVLAEFASGDDVVLCSQVCPENEVYTATKASCQPNCFTKNPELFLCGSISGCICREGYVRNIKKKCIPASECRKATSYKNECPQNEVFGEGAACQMTCQTRELAKRIRCISATGCHCKDNYIRDSYTGICMPWNTCPKCLQYENWVCGPNGCGDDEGGYCECKQGYIKNESDDTCILDCDGPKCHENEEYSETGVSVNCLEDKTKRSDGYKGCICNEGFAKNPYTQQCVLKDKCPPKCPKNESYGCGSPMCEKTCNNYKEICTIQNIRCEDQCYCNPGFARNSYGKCVNFEQC